MVHTGFRPLYFSVDQLELDAEYEFDQDMPQLIMNGAADLLIPKPLYLTPPKSIFEKASDIIGTNNSFLQDNGTNTQLSPIPFQTSLVNLNFDTLKNNTPLTLPQTKTSPVLSLQEIKPIRYYYSDDEDFEVE